jgi:hypothetical protein
MQNIQECSKSLPCDFSDLSFVHQSLVEGFGGVLFLHVIVVSITAVLLAICILRDFAGNVESHLDKLIACCRGLSPSVLGVTCVFAIRPIRLRVCVKVEFDRDLVLACLICVRDL